MKFDLPDPVTPMTAIYNARFLSEASVISKTFLLWQARGHNLHQTAHLDAEHPLGFINYQRELDYGAP